MNGVGEAATKSRRSSWAAVLCLWFVCKNHCHLVAGESGSLSGHGQGPLGEWSRVSAASLRQPAGGVEPELGAGPSQRRASGAMERKRRKKQKNKKVETRSLSIKI